MHIALQPLTPPSNTMRTLAQDAPLMAELPCPAVKKAAAVLFGSSLSTAVAVSWGLRGGLIAAFVISAVSLINAVRKENGLGPLKKDLVANVVTQALLARASSNTAAPILGQSNGSGLNILHFLRQVYHQATQCGAEPPDDATADDFAINNVVNPGVLVLFNDFVTLGFAMMVCGRAIRMTVAPESVPLNLRPGHVSADSAFQLELTALGSAFVGLVGYNLAVAIRAREDGRVVLGPPPALTPTGAAERSGNRMEVGARCFTAPLLGTGGRLRSDTLLGIAGGTAALLESYEQDINPYVAGFINGGLLFVAFITIAHYWGVLNACFDLPPAKLAALVDRVPEEQRAQVRAIQRQQLQLLDDRWGRPMAANDWRGQLRSRTEALCDTVIESAHKALVAALVAVFLATARRDTVGATVEDWEQARHDASSTENLVGALALMCMAGILIGKCVSAVGPVSQEAPADVRSRLAAEDPPREAGPDLQSAWRRGMFIAMADGALSGCLAMAGVLPVASAMVLAAGATLFDGSVATAAANKLFACFYGERRDERVVEVRAQGSVLIHGAEDSPTLEAELASDIGEELEELEEVKRLVPEHAPPERASVPHARALREIINADPPSKSLIDADYPHANV